MNGDQCAGCSQPVTDRVFGAVLADGRELCGPCAERLIAVTANRLLRAVTRSA